MADTVKEIYNGTLTYGNYSSGLQTLFTTDTSTQYVIKDVQLVASGYSPTEAPALTINTTAITQIATSLSGWEVVDVSSAAKIKNMMVNDPMIFDVGYMDSSTASMSYASAGGLDASTSGGFATTSHTVPTLTSITTQLTNYSYILWWGMIGSNFYYATHNGNDSQGLYRRAGSINGTETTVFTGSYTGICFDGTSSFYWVQSNTLKKHDATTNITSSIMPGSFSSGSTYCSICVCNNVIFWLGCYNASGNIYTYDVGKGQMSYLSYSDTFSSNVNGWIPFYDSTTSTFKIYVGNLQGSNSSWGIFTANYNTTTGVVSSPSYTASSSGPSTGLSSIYARTAVVASGYCVFMGSSGTNTTMSTMYLLDSSFKVLASKALPVLVYSGQAYGNTRIIPKVVPTTSDKNTLGPSISLRITGIKIT